MTDPAELALRDIHLPPEPAWWPPAPGWWILSLLVIVIALITYYFYRRHLRRQQSALNIARQELEKLCTEFDTHKNQRQLVADISILLRRLSISAYPRSDTAGLTGEEWLRFLDSDLQEKPFSRGAGRILVDAPYRPAIEEGEIQPLLDACEMWMQQLENQGGGKSK